MPFAHNARAARKRERFRRTPSRQRKSRARVSKILSFKFHEVLEHFGFYVGFKPHENEFFRRRGLELAHAALELVEQFEDALDVGARFIFLFLFAFPDVFDELPTALREEVDRNSIQFLRDKRAELAAVDMADRKYLGFFRDRRPPHEEKEQEPPESHRPDPRAISLERL